ncbi:MAG: sodium-dependent transporter [Bacteroidales bacterium]|nr:sodium-dependent transporter [Bacteroidales bacterium]
MSRDSFGSRLGALMALVGSAVGLGNFWKFPYMAGKNGGAVFILVYVLFMVILCLPLMLSEFVIGRRSQSNPIGAFRKLAPGTKWFFTGLTGVVAAFVILSFYSVVGGWVIKYFVAAVFSGFSAQEGAATLFSTFSQSAVEPVIYHIVFLGLTMGIIIMGIKNGIEKWSKILMPTLFVMILFLAAYALCLPNAGAGVRFLLQPDFSQLTSAVVLDALGQGLFSLSLGMGAVITYSSYMSKGENLFKISLMTIGMDLGFALLAGFVIFPAVFSFGFAPDKGPGLLFTVLPQIFAQMSFGRIFAVVFFAVLIIAALSSSISLLEVITTYATEEWKISRKKTVFLAGGAVTVLGALCSLSLGCMGDVKIFGNIIFDFFDKFSSIFLMPIGAFFITLFVGWKMKRSAVFDELSNANTLKVRYFKIIYFLIRYVVPIGIVIVFLNMLEVF